MSPVRPSMDHELLRGLRARDVLEVVGVDDVKEGLQVVLVDGTSMWFTIWTVIEKIPDARIPDYFWPPDEFLQRSLGFPVPDDGLEILSVTLDVNDHGVVVAFEDHLVVVGSYAGNITPAVREP